MSPSHLVVVVVVVVVVAVNIILKLHDEASFPAP
jgi:hypothetical protein